MKPMRLLAVKRDLNVIRRGVRNSVRVLVRWINGAPDKDTSKRRLLITAGVPATVIVIGSTYPVPAVLGSFTAFFVAVFWYARVEEQEMKFSVMDFEGPFHIHGRVVDFEGLLVHLVASHRHDTLQAIGDTLHDDFEGPDLTDEEIAAQIRFYGLSHPSVVDPSPAQAEAAPSSGEKAGQDHAEGAPEGAEASQGSAGALRKVMSLASAARGYTGSSAKDKGKTDDRREEQGDGRLDQDERNGEPDRGDTGQGDGGGPPVRDPEEGPEEPGRVPDQDRRDPEEPAPLAEGVSAGRE